MAEQIQVKDKQYPIHDLHYIIDVVATLFQTGSGLETFQEPEMVVSEFQNKLNAMLAEGSINGISAYMFSELFLGGLLLPESNQLNLLINKGAPIDKVEAISAIANGNQLYSNVTKLRDGYWEGANVSGS